MLTWRMHSQRKRIYDLKRGREALSLLWFVTALAVKTQQNTVTLNDQYSGSTKGKFSLNKKLIVYKVIESMF